MGEEEREVERRLASAYPEEGTTMLLLSSGQQLPTQRPPAQAKRIIDSLEPEDWVIIEELKTAVLVRQIVGIRW